MIVCRSAAELQRLRDVNQLVGHVLEQLREAVAVGVTTEELDALAEREIRAGGAVPAFKGYKGYPATICASVNEQVVHGIPSTKTVLGDGDIISIDLGAKMGGFFGDSAVTVGVGQISTQAGDLLRVTKSRCGRPSRRFAPARACRISGTPCRVTSSSSAFRWCASLSATASVRSCTKSRRFRTTESPAAARGSPRVWCWQSSRW
jgi:hypothetical protein